MPKTLPPLTWFRAFESAARHLSFTQAADELGVTQSAISQHVRALEGRLESQLFVRANRALHLTDAGRLLLPDVTTALGQLEIATERFLPHVSKPRLTIATSASIAQWIIVPAIAAFQRANPGIVVHLMTTVWPDDFSAISADIEIRFGAASVVGHEATLLQPSYLHAVAAPDIAAGLGADCWAGLANTPLIQPVGISQSWATMATEKRGALEPSLLVDTHGLAVDLAVAGAGAALTHVQISKAAVARGALVELPLGQLKADEGYYIATRPSGFAAERDRFVEWFNAHLASGHVAE
jgi:LysR family glycine cleavage system transcriptional activator